MDNIKEYFLNYLNGYNQTWVDKDLEKLKEVMGQFKMVHSNTHIHLMKQNSI